MNFSPYTPPTSSLLEENHEGDNLSLPDLSSQSNAELREILGRPDHYTPESLHAAARELTIRHAIPRYYTRLHSREMGKTISVNRDLHLTLKDRINIYFSDSKIIHFSILIIIVQCFALFFSTMSFLKYFQYPTKIIMSKMLTSMTLAGIGVISHACFILFFYTIYRVHSVRKPSIM